MTLNSGFALVLFEPNWPEPSFEQNRSFRNTVRWPANSYQNLFMYHALHSLATKQQNCRGKRHDNGRKMTSMSPRHPNLPFQSETSNVSRFQSIYSCKVRLQSPVLSSVTTTRQIKKKLLILHSCNWRLDFSNRYSHRTVGDRFQFRLPLQKTPGIFFNERDILLFTKVMNHEFLTNLNLKPFLRIPK